MMYSEEVDEMYCIWEVLELLNLYVNVHVSSMHSFERSCSEAVIYMVTSWG
jgi:hypothetical protein